jgi:hypothetical protein
MLIAAILFATSVVGLGQFALYYWRAILAGVAAQPLSDHIRTVAGLAGASLGPADFNALLNLHEVTPGLKGDNGGLWAVRAYYRVVETFGRLAGLGLPLVAAWSEREMTTCTRYVAVRVSQRLERNLVCAAEIRSC